MNNLKNTFCLFGLILVLSCAQQRTLEGGPKDTTPPAVILATPPAFSTNVDVNIKNIKILFDEYILLKNPFQQIVISPPLNPAPSFSPVDLAKKNIDIRFSGSLEKNTTYSINFGESIQDNTEGNKLSFFKYVFSTGNQIDSIEIKGKVVDAYGKTLDKEDIVVGLYKVDKAFTDSVIYTQRPYYFTKADKEGNYQITHIKEGPYFLMAFSGDIINYIYNPRKGKLAFEPAVLNLRENGFYPLRLFKEVLPFKPLTPKEVSAGHIQFPFEGSLNKVHLEATEKFDRACFLPDIEASIIHYWYKPVLKEKETQETTDAHFKLFIEGKSQDLKVGLAKKYLAEFSLKKTSQISSPLHPMWFDSETPIYLVDQSKIKISKVKESSYEQVPFELLLPKDNLKKIGFEFLKEPGGNYEITIAPEAIEDIVGNKNPLLTFTESLNDKNDYGHLELKLSNLPKKPFWLELLNKEDKVVEKFYGHNSVYTIRYLKPETYRLRISVDENEDKEWNPGSLASRKPPEPVYLYEKPIQIKPMWDIRENWAVLPKSSDKN